MDPAARPGVFADLLAAAVPEVLPRLGPAVSGSRAALWAAGLVLLAAWMPFDNGLRPEGQITTGALITYVLIERAITSGRLTPAALAIITAAFTLGIQPTGLIAVAALIAGGRPVIRILARRRGRRDLAAHRAAVGRRHHRADSGVRRSNPCHRAGSDPHPNRHRAEPSLVHRESAVLLPDPPDGGRVAVTAVRFPDHCAVVVHFDVHHVAAQASSRRGARPAWRLMGVIFSSMFVLMFTPRNGFTISGCSPFGAPPWRHWPPCWSRARCCGGRETA